MRIERDGLRCIRCGHEWLPRRDWDPFVCPKCKSPFWDHERMLRKFRAEATIEWPRGFRPEQARVDEFGTRLGASRHPRVRWAGKRLRVGVDVSASSEANAEIQARRLIVSRARATGLKGSGVLASIDIAVTPTDRPSVGGRR